MSRKSFVIGALIVVFVFVAGVFQLKASQSDYYKMNKAMCAKYIDLSQRALDENRLYEAKLYAQKAVQVDPWNKAAWNNYNMILIKITGGNQNITLEPTKEKAQLPKEAPSADGNEEEIEGC